MADVNKTILFIEDEDFFRKPLTEMLRQEGYHVREAKDGRSGYEQAMEHHPDLILLDIVMEGYDGLTVLRMLREDNWGKEVPVMILTNLAPDNNDIQDTLPYTQPVLFLSKVDTTMEKVVEHVNKFFTTGELSQ